MRKSVVMGAAIAITLTLSTPSWAVSNYTIVVRTGTSFSQFGTHNLFSSSTDDSVVEMSTTLTGAQHLAFPVHFYGKNYKSLWVSSNGNVQFGSSASTAWSNDCLPSAVITNKLAAVFWDDLTIDPSVGQGVFWKLLGTGTNRRLVLYWNAVTFSGTTPVQAQLSFFQKQNTISMDYNTSGGDSATIGVQNGASPSKQFACNSGLGTQVTPGLRLDFVR